MAGRVMVERFFCQDAAKGGELALDSSESNHLARVRRLGPGDAVVVFDGQGFATSAEVVQVERGRVVLQSVGLPLPDRLAPIELTLATALPKGDRLDWLVEKATEIGVARLVPLVTRRSVVDPRASKLERLRRAVIEASKQCGRNRLLRIDPPSSWVAVLSQARTGVRVLADPNGPGFPHWPRLSPGESAWIAVGPEGGFTEEEVSEAVEAGWSVVGIGPTILRVETAGLAGCLRMLATAERVQEMSAS
ncbi:MAG: 16S rRNA (uracil(1498)-N(3))-methyltransferase [Isosphaeraceae bacterium]